MTERTRLENASAIARVMSFAIDLFLASVVRAVIQIIFISEGELREYKKALDQFRILFPTFKMNEISDYHVFFFTNTAAIYDMFLKVGLIFSISGVAYNIFSYLAFRRRTIGQRLTSLETININDDKTPRFYKFILKSILTPLPFVLTVGMLLCSALNMFGIHKLIIANTLSLRILRTIISVSNPVAVVFMAFIFFMLWFSVYFLLNKLILSDILSRTRVVYKDTFIKTIFVNENGEKEVKMESRESGAWIVEWGDAIINYINKFNNFLKQENKRIIQYLRNKINKIKK
jgi:hypothetical protein